MALRRLVQEQRPHVGAAAGIADSTTRAPEPLELRRPGLRGVARLGLPPVAEIRRAAQQPDREPVEPRGGDGALRRAPTRAVRRPRPSAPSARRCRATGRAGRCRRAAACPSAASALPCRRRPTAAGSSTRCRCRARARRAPRRARRRCLPRSRPSSGPGGAGCARCRTTGSLRARPRRTRAGSPCRRRPRRRRARAGRRSRGVRDVIGVDPRAVRRADAGRIDQVLDEQRAPRERPRRGAAQRLLEPGDGGVVRVVGHVTGQRRRHALDLDLRTRDDERGDLDQRRCRPRVAEHLLPNRVDERPVVHVGQVHRHLDDVRERASGGGEHRPHVLEHRRACATTSSPPTSSLLVDGNDAADEQEAPASTASVKCEIGSA